MAPALRSEEGLLLSGPRAGARLDLPTRQARRHALPPGGPLKSNAGYAEIVNRL
ncbi:hypothetical protein DyAD56_00030 [Dyella sp. AD56]|nr:hypothetical protein DyAD56_00030 [Dyella sp. AD56]